MKIDLKKYNNYHLYTYLLMLYYLVAPMEDMLTGRFGTAAKYIAVVIVLFGVGESEWKLRPFLNRYSSLLIYLMAVSVASCIWASDLSTATGRLVAYLLVPGLALFTGQLDFSKEEYESIISVAIIGGMITVAYLSITGKVNIFGFQRLQLTDGNDQNNFAALMFLPLGLCIGRVTRKGIVRKMFYTGFSLVFLYVILLTGSRGGLLAVLLLVLVLAFFASKGKRIRTILGLLVVLVFAYFVILPMLPDFIQTRLFENDSYINTMNDQDNRFAFWKLAFTEIVPKSLPFGVGAGCTPLWLGRFYGTNTGMHNTYINMLCEFGVFGLPVFLWMLYRLFKDKLKQKRVNELALLIGICCIIFFLDAYAKKFFWNVIMLLMISNRAVANKEKCPEKAT